jgi:hypothetical protein
MIEQTMSLRAVQTETKYYIRKYATEIAEGGLTLEGAHASLRNSMNDPLCNLFQIAALAQTIACFQCSKE